MSVIDTAWGLGFIVIAFATIFHRIIQGYEHIIDMRGIVILLLVFVWGSRLALYLHKRNKKAGEDFRYQTFRKEWGEKTNIISYFKVFMLQMVLLFIVALPVSLPLLTLNNSPLGLMSWLGIGIWCIGFSIEYMADQQLKNFKAKGQKGIIKTGLWRYSRHPNYFGEALLWWGMCFLSWEIGQHIFIATLIGPALLTLFLIKISGVPMLEEKYKDNPEYQEYKKRTSAFIPLPPKNSQL